MARVRMVTRTVKGTMVKAKAVNIETNTIEEIDLVLGTVYKNEKEILNAAKEAYETETLKIVQVYNPIEFAELYGMREDFFIAHATKIEKNNSNEEE